jgi:hypothetical protein
MGAARSSSADHDRVGADRSGADAEETCTEAEAGVAAAAEVTAAAAEAAVTAAAEAVVTAAVTAAVVTKTVPSQRRLVQVLVGECPGTRLVFICVG